MLYRKCKDHIVLPNMYFTNTQLKICKYPINLKPVKPYLFLCAALLLTYLINLSEKKDEHELVHVYDTYLIFVA